MSAAQERIDRAVSIIRAAAWDAAGNHLHMLRLYDGRPIVAPREYHGEAMGLLSALFFLDACPDDGCTQYDVDSLIGVRAWVAGEASHLLTLSHRLDAMATRIVKRDLPGGGWEMVHDDTAPAEVITASVPGVDGADSFTEAVGRIVKRGTAGGRDVGPGGCR